MAERIALDVDELALLRRVRDYVDRHYAEPLNVEHLAAKAYMSAAHFSRRFKIAFGQSPYQYVMSRRVERAMVLLRQGASVTDACFAVGASSLGSFSSSFLAITGQSPSAYREADHSAINALPSCVAREFSRPGVPRPPERKS